VWSVCLCARPRVPCVPCVSRLLPVSFYRFKDTGGSSMLPGGALCYRYPRENDDFFPTIPFYSDEEGGAPGGGCNCGKAPIRIPAM